MITSASLAASLTAGVSARLPMSDGGGFTPPSIDDFYPEPFAFLGTPIEMNRVIMVRMLMAVALVLVFGVGT